ncbi:MAG TPA: TVP38/TMEM64 family protein [Phycisphaerales bacterium]|nr:TVP38/TMEM64 family protein [Phycisphaerales bacterium]
MTRENTKRSFCQRWRPVLLTMFVIAAVVAVNVFGLGRHLSQLQEWIDGLGQLGYVVFILLHIASMIAVTPRSVFSVTAGILFDPVTAIILVSISSVAGACATFLIARYLAKDMVHRWFARHERFENIYDLTAKYGAIMVAATRLTPFFPATILNYGFGVTKITFTTYFLSTLVSMIPGTVMYVFGADVVSKMISDVGISPPIVIALTVAVLFCVVVFFIVRKRITCMK